MSERTHWATQVPSGKSPAKVEWRAHTLLCLGVDLFDTRLVTDRSDRVTCKRCLQKLAS